MLYIFISENFYCGVAIELSIDVIVVACDDGGEGADGTRGTLISFSGLWTVHIVNVNYA